MRRLKVISISGLLLIIISLALYYYAKSNRGISDQSASAYRQRENSTYKKKNFDSLMKNVVSWMPDLDTYKELVANKAFLEMFDHSPSYYDDATRLLSKQDVTDDQALICVLAMQNLNLDDYVKLCGFYIKLNDRNKISDDTIERLIGGFLNIRIIPDNYDDPKVITVLNAFEDDPKTSPNLKSMIEYILAGK